MKLIVLCLLLGVLTVYNSAQSNWEIVETCMDDLPENHIPSENWDFDGVIVTSLYPTGVRGVRADLDVEYFIALESEYTFPIAGAVSPDGKYFAYPIGWLQRAGILSRWHPDYVVDRIRVVRTNGNTNETYIIPLELTSVIETSSPLGLVRVEWYDSQFVYYPYFSHFIFGEKTSDNLYNIYTDDYQAIAPSNLEHFSPDGSRAFRGNEFYDLEDGSQLLFDRERSGIFIVRWYGDSSHFLLSDSMGLALFNRDGEFVETITDSPMYNFVISPDATKFAAWDRDYTLYIGTMESRTIRRLCFQADWVALSPYITNLAWSPDSEALAFSHQGYLVILDSTTLQARVLNHLNYSVIVWIPLR